MLIILPLHAEFTDACRNEFCMQRPRRRRRRQRSEEKVAWLGGLEHVEDVWPMAQEASAEVTVAGVGCGRKKKKLQRREKGWKEKRESRDGSLVVSWGLCWLPVVEKLVVALIGGWNGGEREGEKKLQKRGREAGFWPTLDPLFSSLRP
jgi:hypothetical protein